MSKELEDVLNKFKMFSYNLWDKYGDCNCEYCVIERSSHSLDKLNYMLNYSINTEKFEVCSRIKNELIFRKNNNIGSLEMSKILNIIK